MKRKSLVVGFDVDGVLADYSTAFSEIGNQLYGLPVLSDPDVKYWDWHRFWGSREKISQIWNHVRNSDDFWRELPTLTTASQAVRIRAIARRTPVYAITSRMDTQTSALHQTVAWLKTCLTEAIQCVISSKKGQVCNALGIDCYIDDKFTNCIDVVKNSPKTQVFLMVRKHNESLLKDFPQYFESRGGKAEIVLVESLDYYLDYIESKL